MTGKTVLLTGGAGMVGRNVQADPQADAWTVLAPRSAELDLTDEAAVRAYFAAKRPDAVIHAAGRVGGIQANIAHPVAFLEQNVAMGRNVILAARDAGVRTFLNLSSTCMYPREGENPLREETILTGALEPTNEGYAIAKIMAMKLCEYIRREDPSLQYKTLIPCNLYGYHDSFAPEKSHLVPAILRKMHEAKTTGAGTVEIWGDGTARREFMFAADLADAIWKALSDIETLPDAMNIGIGHDFTINEYYAAAAETVGWTGTFTHDLSKPVGMKQKLSSTARQEAWGWRPATSLRDGLAATYRHFLEEHA